MSLTVRETGGEEDLLTLFETLCPFLPFTHFHSCPGQGKDPICGQRGLSNLLKSAEATWGHAWELSGPDENGVARVTVPMGEPGKVLNVFDIDLSRGGAIVGFAVMGRDGGVFMKMEDLQLQEVEGVWLPASYWLVWDPRVGLSVRFSYQYQSVNRPLTPDDFLFPIPEGVTIYDKITGNSYDSNVPEELRQKLLIESVSEFQQLPEEAPASTPDTRVAEATASPPDGGEQARPGLRWLLLAGSGVFMLIGVVSLGYWAKNRGKRSGQKSPF
jgi:hypothetical protein